jgi:hypothetical protein
MLPFFCKFLDPDPLTWLERNANFFSKSEGDCTSETAAGQFSIFVAVEEKDGPGFSRRDTDQGTSEVRAIDLVSCATYPAVERRQVSLAKPAAGLSTARSQEMQKPAGSPPMKWESDRQAPSIVSRTLLACRAWPNHPSSLSSNSRDAVLMAPQWSAPGTSQS